MAMAEIEMDVDMAQTFSFDGQMDEDLIDYDIDTTEEQKQAAWSSHDDEKNPDHAAADAQTDVSMGVDSKMSEAANEPTEPQEVGGDGPHNEDVNDGANSAASTSSKHSPSQHEEPYHDDVDIFQEDGAEEPAEANAGQNDTAIESHDVENEINYEDGEDTAVAQGSYDEPAGEEYGADDVGSSHDQDLAENASATTPTNPVGATAQTPRSANEPESVAEEEDEITWEQDENEDEDENATTHDGTESRVETENVEGESASVHGTEDADEQSDAEVTQTAETPDHSNDVDFDHDDTVVAGLEEGDSTTGQQEESVSQPDHPRAENNDFPAITVQYSGDEFPLFSQYEGFFSDSSVLDDNIESLLAGFRAELTHEIASEDELVFQVDELGLEFAESSLRDSLSSITLRQILEIFDLLVKNQDPDSSRTLYTYLFTRPSTSKRFEFLIESAAAGKGLDEVVHLFESPMPHNTAVVDSTHATDDAEENLDSYGSIADENADGEDAVSQQLEQQDNDNEDADEKQTLDDEAEYHDNDEALMDGADEHVEDNEEEDQPLLADEVNEEDQQLVDEPIADLVAEPDHQATAEEPSPGHSPDATDTNEHAESDSNAFIHLDPEEEYNEAERAYIPVTPEPLDDENAVISAANTNTTNTLTLDNETMPHVADTNTEDIIDHEIADEALVDQDELAEIDWRDEPDSTDITGHDEPLTPSGVSKRPRPDDEHGMEEGQDAKRRRP